MRPTRWGTVAIVAVLLAGLGGGAVAGTIDGLGGLPTGFTPQLHSIVADKQVHFLKSGNGCPNATPACEERAYLVRGDNVVVVAVKGDYVDVVFTGGPPRFRATRGWLPRGAVAPAPAATAPTWIGSWQNGSDGIEIKPAATGRLRLSGAATWGGDDPKRVAAGGVNTGDFDTSLAVPSGGTVTFSPNPDGDGAPATLDPPLSADDCVVRMWLLDPYLVVADNDRCGGANVTFSNVYRRADAKP